MTGYIFVYDGVQYDPNGIIDPPIKDVSAHNRTVDASYIDYVESEPIIFYAYYENTGEKKLISWHGIKIGIILYTKETVYYRGYTKCLRVYVRARIGQSEYWGVIGNNYMSEYIVLRKKGVKRVSDHS